MGLDEAGGVGRGVDVGELTLTLMRAWREVCNLFRSQAR